jgi:hypothetical protein
VIKTSLVKGEVALLPKHHSMKVYRGMEAKLYEWSALHFSCSTARKRAPATPWIGH